MRIASAFLVASLALPAVAPAQLPRLYVGGAPTNLNADFSQLFWTLGGRADEFFVLLPVGGNPMTEVPFPMFRWNGHPMMQQLFPGGWYEVQFHFGLWAYLSPAPCALLPAPGQTMPHAGIDSTYDYGPPLFTGPVLGVHSPFTGCALGNQGVMYLGGNPGTAMDETFALYLRDYFWNSLNACVGGTPVTWVAVQIRFNLVPH